jgi:O-antigen/teichoic acid export membrane protein
MSELQDIRRQTLTGLSWTATSRMFQLVAQFAVTAVLARLLVPNDFGLIAMISVFTGFAAIFVDFGLSSALVQRTDVEDRHLSSAFWLNLSVGAALMLVVMGIAPGVAAFYGEPQLLPLTVALAPTFLIGSLAGVQTAILQREMRFKKLSVINNVAFVGGSALGIGMALAGFGVWSFIGLTLVSSMISAVLLWVLSPWRPGARPDRVTINELWGFSSRLTGFNAVNYWARNADNLLIGRFIGVTQLAFYNRAYSIMTLPGDVSSSVTTPVIFPALSRLQDDRERVKRVYLRALGLIALVMFPVSVGLYVVAKPFILTIYGPRWAPVVPLLQIFSVVSVLQTLGRTTGWIFLSQGRADWMMRWGLVTSVTAICSFFIGLPWGVRGIAISYACWNLLVTYPLFKIIGQLIEMSVLEVIQAVLGVAVASLFMGLIVWFVELRVPDGWGSGTELAIGVLTGVASYLAAVHVTSPAPYREFRRLLGDYRRRPDLRRRTAL